MSLTKYLAFLVFLLVPAQLLAIDEFKDLKLIHRLPETQREVESAFQRSGGNRCELIPKGRPVEVNSFMSYLTERDRREQKGRPFPIHVSVSSVLPDRQSHAPASE